jgi:hypothetical protein
MPEQPAHVSHHATNPSGTSTATTHLAESLNTQNTPPKTAGFMLQLKDWLYRYRVIFLLLWVCGLVVIAYAGIERRYAVTDKHNLDKVVHVSVFAAMAFWPIMVCGRRMLSVFLVLVVALGAPGLELLQAHFGNGRIASLADMIASLGGVLAGILIAGIVRKAG